jgi:ATP-binding cassette subfamily B protein
VPRGGAPKRPKDLRRTLKVFFAYLGHAKLSLLVVAILVSFSGLANLFGTYMIKPVVNYLAAGDVEGFLGAVKLTAGIYIIGVASCAGYTQVMVGAAQKVVFDIRRDLLAHIETLPLKFFDQTNRGDVMSYFTNDVDTISEALNNSFANLIQAVIQAIGTLVLLFVLDWQLTLITVAFDALIILYIRFSSQRSKHFFSLQQDTLAGLDGYIEEMVAAQKVVKVFNREGRNLEDFKGYNEKLREAGTTAQAYAATMTPVTVCLTYANYAIVAVTGALLAISGQTDVGSLASYLVFVRQAAMPFNQITQLGPFF